MPSTTRWKRSLRREAQLIERVKHLLGPRANGDIFREIHPANHSVRIDQKLGWTSNICAFRSCARMQYVVTANDFRLGIGK